MTLYTRADAGGAITSGSRFALACRPIAGSLSGASRRRSRCWSRCTWSSASGGTGGISANRTDTSDEPRRARLAGACGTVAKFAILGADAATRPKTSRSNGWLTDMEPRRPRVHSAGLRRRGARSGGRLGAASAPKEGRLGHTDRLHVPKGSPYGGLCSTTEGSVQIRTEQPREGNARERAAALKRTGGHTRQTVQGARACG